MNEVNKTLAPLFREVDLDVSITENTKEAYKAQLSYAYSRIFRSTYAILQIDEMDEDKRSELIAVECLKIVKQAESLFYTRVFKPDIVIDPLSEN